MAVVQIAMSGDWLKHWTQAQALLQEIATVRNADKLYEISQERKPRMLLLPYGIPMTVAAIGYFAFAGLDLTIQSQDTSGDRLGLLAFAGFDSRFKLSDWGTYDDRLSISLREADRPELS